MIISSKVPEKFKNLTVHKYLTSRFTYLTGQEWQQRLIQRRVFLNEKSCTGDEIVLSNDIISYNMTDFVEPPADLNYKIVYEDDWLLGIDKPGNLLVHHNGKSFRSNLIYQLRYVHSPAYLDAGIVNRLDRETSGIVIVAKNREALKKMNTLIKERKIYREYIALVYGIPIPPSGKIDLPIGKKENSKIKYRFCINGKNPKHALTRFTTIRVFKKRYSLLNLFPETGRTHQLRVHLHGIGHTILGDKLYGMTDDEYINWRQNPDNTEILKNLAFNRQALHCSKVIFKHPFTNTRCKITASLPNDLNSFLFSKKANIPID
jgi:RluA family pseudouridine synthase